MTRRVKTHIRLGIRSVSSSDQSPRCPHEETLGPYLPIAKFRGVSPRNFAEKTLGEISDFYFSPRKKIFRARGVPRRNAKKELFSWADLYIANGKKSCSILQQFTGRKCVTLLGAVLRRHPSHRPCLLDVRRCNVVFARYKCKKYM